jgi:glycoside/pentoside/hexuronide:cation symporter, GPH family
LANGIPAALFFLYLEHGLGADSDIRSMFIAGYFVAAIAAIPTWAWLSGRLGKHRTWCVAMGIACVAFATVPFLAPGSFAAFGAVCLITGMALGADLALPPAIQADVVDYGALKDGTARAGTLFALWAMSTKFALALAVGIALPAVELLGFDPGRPTDAGRDALTMIYALVPVVIKTIAIAVIWQFPLTGDRMAIVQRGLDARASRRKPIGMPMVLP